MKLKNISLAAFVVGGGMLLSACGGGDDAPLVATANSDLIANVTPETVHAVLDMETNFSSGIKELGTSATTTLTLSGKDRAKPSFDLKSGDYSAKGDMQYGSCIFVILQSNFPASRFPLLQVGQRTEISPCTVKVKTTGLKANMNSILTRLNFELGEQLSMPGLIPLSINSKGVVIVNDEPVGNVNVVLTTGAGS